MDQLCRRRRHGAAIISAACKRSHVARSARQGSNMWSEKRKLGFRCSNRQPSPPRDIAQNTMAKKPESAVQNMSPRQEFQYGSPADSKPADFALQPHVFRHVMQTA